MEGTRISIERISAGSVVDIAYGRIRGLIEEGGLGPSARLRQGDLADALGISRTSVREALHRLTAEELVEFKANRGFFVASFKLDAVLERLELRQIMEPGIARLAAARRTDAHLRELQEIVDGQFSADTPRIAHDLSRTFHIRLAATTGNDQFGKVLESLWSLDIGRRLLARRSATPGWQSTDATEHRGILRAVSDRDEDLAAELMQQHLAATYHHWEAQARAERDAVEAFENAAPSIGGDGRG
jgi:DNA-binding GntR family transcriptional regulator